MSAYSKATSHILDTLWSNDDFRQHFHTLGVELADLGALIQKVFAPAYLQFKADLDIHARQMLEMQIVAELMNKLHQRPSFREMWTAWDSETRDSFIKEQSELQLARLLVQVYEDDLAAAYQRAYDAYLAQREHS